MFRSIQRRCIEPPPLLSSRTDPESVQQNNERLFRHGINSVPVSCASVAYQWHLEKGEKFWTRALCFRHNVSAIQSIILEYLREDWFFPIMPRGKFAYRLTSKMGLSMSISDREARLTLSGQAPFELDPWV